MQLAIQSSICQANLEHSSATQGLPLVFTTIVMAVSTATPSLFLSCPTQHKPFRLQVLQLDEDKRRMTYFMVCMEQSSIDEFAVLLWQVQRISMAITTTDDILQS
jgi:hypothetical protein